MSSADPMGWWKDFDAKGEVEVRQFLGLHHWNEDKRKSAEQWLRHQASVRSTEAERSTLAEAKSANDLAKEANRVASEAAASARLSAEAARINNTIATLALIAAIIAMAISIFGMFIKR